MIVVQLMHGFPARREHSAYHDPFMGPAPARPYALK